MHLLTNEQLDKVDSLLRLLREAAQMLLEMPMYKAAHDVAASVEVLEEMFHVERTPPLPPASGNGSPFSSTEMRSVPRETSGFGSERYDHVHEHQQGRSAPMAAENSRPNGTGRTRAAQFQALWKAQRRPTVPRGRFRGRARRRR